MINNNILSDQQFGFVSGRSTITQLIVTLNEWLFSLDNDINIDAAYMDFRKAFDTVPHRRLINKLKGYNISGPVLDWIESFLSERQQFVKINNACSTHQKVTSGVPQGSVLGPTLFIFFINDLPNVVKNSSVKIFADDTKVYREIKNDNDVKDLQNAIDEMYNWTNKWLLKFNKQKCKIIHLGNNNVKNDYFIGNEDQRIPLDKSDLEKDLGIHIDEKLNFKEHIKKTVKKANYAAYKIRSRPYAPLSWCIWTITRLFVHMHHLFFNAWKQHISAVLYDISDINGLKLMFFMIADKNPTFN